MKKWSIEHTSASVVGSSPLNGLCSEDDGGLCIKYLLILIENKILWFPWDHRTLKSWSKIIQKKQFAVSNLKKKICLSNHA